MTVQPDNTAKEGTSRIWTAFFNSMQQLNADKSTEMIHDQQQQAITLQSGLLGSAGRTSLESPLETHQFIQLAFVINPNQEIHGFSNAATDTLGYPPIRLLGRKFHTLLEKQSWGDWDLLLQQSGSQPAFNRQIALQFRTQSRLVMPAVCAISRLFNTTDIRIEAFLYWQEPSMEKTADARKGHLQKGSPDEKALAKHLHDYILSNLSQPLPTIKALARMLATNECRLKESFKDHYGTGIHQFYNSCRLNHARILILQTSLPLTEIAEQSGFTYYPSFSKAFKKKFGFPPQQSRKHR